MADVLDDLLSGPAQEGTPAPTGASSVIDSLLTGQELRAPERPHVMGTGLIDDPEFGAPSLMIARASLAPDVKDQIKRYAEHFNQPETEFGVVDGEIVRFVPERNAFAKVVPTIGGQESAGDIFQGFARQTASGLGPALPQGAATVAGVATAPTGGSIPAIGGVAFVTDWARQAIDKLLAGEPLVPFAGAEYDYANMAGHGALAMGGQAVGVGIGRMLTKNPMGIEAWERQRAMDIVEQARWRALDEEAKRRGITLSVGQKTGLRSLMAKERQLMRFPETADMVSEFRDAQRMTQIPGAYADEVSRLHPDAGREAMIGSFREAADDVVNTALRARQEQAKIAYGKAYERYSSIDSPFLQNLWKRDIIKDATAEARRISNARGELMGPLDAELGQYAREAASQGKIPYPEGGVARGLSLNTWDRIKRGLDEIWKKEVRDDGTITAYGAAVRDTARQMVKELDSLTGGSNGLYAQARKLYGSASEGIDDILEGGVGLIQKMKGPDRVNMVTKIFGGKAMLPEEIKRIRQTFISAGRQKDWDAGLAAHLSQVLDDSQKSAGLSGNLPGQIYSRLGRDRLQHDTIMAAMGPERGAGFEKFLDIMHAASRSLPEGSPTATDLLPGAGVASAKLKAAGKVLSPDTYWNFGNTVVEGIAALRTPQARIKLAEYLLTEKGGEAIMEFRALAPGTQKAIIATAHILADAGVVALGSLRPSDFPAPMIEEQKRNRSPAQSE